MKISQRLVSGRPFLSVEYFPPKERQDWPAFFQVVDRLNQLKPLFASVTYGAGGSTQEATLEIVSRMQQQHGLETMAHLTCVGAQPDRLRAFLDDLTTAGVGNVLALRGDPPRMSRLPNSPNRRCFLPLIWSLLSESLTRDWGSGWQPIPRYTPRRSAGRLTWAI